MKRTAAVVPVRVGRYTLYGVIGSGGMATVHLGHAASDPGAGATLRLPWRSWRSRVCPAALASEPDVVKSFLDEARLSSCIRHPNASICAMS